MNATAQIIQHPSTLQQTTLTTFAANIAEIKNQVNLIQQVMREVMKQDEHYGVIPGCGDKPALLKPGAEKLMLTFRLANDLDVDVVDMPNAHREYRVKATIYSPNGQRLGTGVGSCSSMETKYRFRTGPVEDTGKPVPRAYWDNRESDPKKAQELIGGKGFSTKKVDGVWKIVKQGERVEHDNPADYYNTVLKMAKKRALVDAVLTSTAASDIFTQDLDDDPELHADIRGGGKTVPTTSVEKPSSNENADTSQSSQSSQSESDKQDKQTGETLTREQIIAYLAGKKIRFEQSEDGTIYAYPEFSDSASRTWLKDHGAKWDSKAKSWNI